MNVFFDQALEPLIPFNAFFEFLHLITGNITRNVFAILVTLMVVVRAFGAFTNNRDRAFLDLLDLRDLLQYGLGGRF